MSPILHPTNFADFATSQSSALLDAMIMKQPVHKIIMASIQIITTVFQKEASNSLQKKKIKIHFPVKKLERSSYIFECLIIHNDN